MQRKKRRKRMVRLNLSIELLGVDDMQLGSGARMTDDGVWIV